MKIENNKIGLLHFTLKDTQGNLIEASGDTPLTYVHGYDSLFPKLEQALADKTVGTQFNCLIPAAEAYGEVNENLIQSGIPLSAFDGIDNLETGMKLEIQSVQQRQFIVVTDISEEGVTIDGNHELAGVDLVFDIEVVGIRDATEEEIAQVNAPESSGCCSSSGCGCS